VSAELNAEPPSFDRSKTLTELENHDWGEPHYDSHVVTSSHAYRKVPVAALETEQLRMLVGQSIGLPFLVHVLLEVLGSDPWAEGDSFRGDLMSAALRSQNHLFWLTNPALLDRLLDIVARMEQDQDVEEFERETFDEFVREAAEGLDYAYHRFFGPERSESWQGRQLPKICADLRFEHRVRLPYYDEPAALRTIWERVLFALELDPSVGE
jgi:hypothetical protein